MQILPIRHVTSGLPYTFLGYAASKLPSDEGQRVKMAVYVNEHGALYYREPDAFARSFMTAYGEPVPRDDFPS